MIQPQDQALQQGVQIGVYEIKDILNVGRFEISYDAWSHHINSRAVLREYFPSDLARRCEDGCTLKVQSESDRSTYDSGLTGFLEQAEILVGISHPNVVCVLNGLEFNGTGYQIMEFETGIPLSRWCNQKQPIPEADFRRLVLGLLDGLDIVHQRGIVHGDIHPSNILVKGNGEPVLIDFAAARLTVAAGSAGIQRALRVGYAAPEMYKRSSQPSVVADLYALGATLYYGMTQSEPKGLALDRVSAIGKGRPDPLQLLSGSGLQDYSEDLLKTIDWMLCPAAQDRPQTVSPVITALSPDVMQAGTSEQPLKSEGETKRSSPAWPQRGLWITGLLGVVVLGSVFFWRLYLGTDSLETDVPDGNKRPGSILKKDDLPRQDSVQVARTNVTAESQIEAGTLKGQEHEPPEIPESESTASVVGKASDPGTRTAAVHRDLQSDSRMRSSGMTTDRPPSPPFKDLKLAETGTPGVVQNASPDTFSIVSENPKTQTPSDENQEIVRRHMAAAEKDLVHLRLTTPIGKNAYSRYLAVLTIDPGHALAREGINRIVERYIWLVEKAIKEGRPRTARVYLARAESVSPESPDLKRMRGQLVEARP